MFDSSVVLLERCDKQRQPQQVCSRLDVRRDVRPRQQIEPEPPPQSRRTVPQPAATQPMRMSFTSEPDDDETVVLSLTNKDVAALAAARNSAPMSSRQPPASFNFDKPSSPGVVPRAPGSSMGDAKTKPYGQQLPAAAPAQADRVAWLPPAPSVSVPWPAKASETSVMRAPQADPPPDTKRAAVRAPERLNFDDDETEEHTLVDPPSFSGDRTTLIRPFPPPSGKGR